MVSIKSDFNVSVLNQINYMISVNINHKFRASTSSIQDDAITSVIDCSHIDKLQYGKKCH